MPAKKPARTSISLNAQLYAQGLALANHRGFGNSFSAYVAWLITQDAAGEVTGQRAARLPQALPAEETRPTRAPRRRAARG